MKNHSVIGEMPAARKLIGSLFALVLVTMPQISAAEIIWSGDFRDGNFLQWHTGSDDTIVTFHQIPQYGRPIQYGGQAPDHVGNGDLLSLVAATERVVNGVLYPAGPTRGRSEYAARVTVKSEAGGGVEPADCDVPNDSCNRRRTELAVQGTLPKFYNGLPYQSERWMSVSIYVPADWEDRGSGWGPIVWDIKPLNDGGGQGACLNISLEPDGGWEVQHKWTDIPNLKEPIPWQQQAPYQANQPKADGSDSYAELLADFPNVTASQEALRTVKGEWTDWVVHMKFDARGSQSGGTGFLDVYNRAGSGSWVHVLKIRPRVVSVGGETFDRGVCFNSPAVGSNPGGFGIKAGMYMESEKVWSLDRNRVLYNANIMVGDENTIFGEMSPDGSAPSCPGSDCSAIVPLSRPNPPIFSF